MDSTHQQIIMTTSCSVEDLLDSIKRTVENAVNAGTRTIFRYPDLMNLWENMVKA